MMNMWTIDKVRDELPKVKIEVVERKPNGKKVKRVVLGQVAGRRLDWPVVYVGEARYEYAWQTIANALNNDRPLKT